MPLPDLNSLNPQVSESYTSEKKFPLRPIVIILVAILLLGGGFYIFNKYSIEKSSIPGTTQNQTDENPPAPGVIAKVGDELIYQRDLDLEIATYPPILPIEQRKQLLLDKIASDSAVLQAGKKEGLISLNPTIYNSEDKDYLKRIKAVEQVKTKIEGEAGKSEGVIVSIWFYNFGEAAPIGYDKGKELALQKITQLHTEVKSGKKTIKQAAEAIKNDPQMTQLDPLSYKQNASQPFNTSVNTLVSFNKDLEKQLLSLSKGGVSDIVLSTEPMFDKPGFYQFGQVTEKVNNNKFLSFDNWFNKIHGEYEITLY